MSQWLEQLFGIRYHLYRRKFVIKFVNNLLAQLTPLPVLCRRRLPRLPGSLDIGQLVAVIAAYRDLPPPIKELIDWDQQRLDVEAKFQQVVEHFELSGDPPDPATDDEDKGAVSLPEAAPSSRRGSRSSTQPATACWTG